MSVVIETIVYCDGCGDNHSGDQRNYTAKYQRESNKAEGWVQRGSKDFCQKCKLVTPRQKRRKNESIRA